MCPAGLHKLDVVGYQNMPALKGQAGVLQVRGARRSGREGYLEAMLTGQCKPVNVRSEHRSAYVYTAPAAPRSAPALLKKRLWRPPVRGGGGSVAWPAVRASLGMGAPGADLCPGAPCGREFSLEDYPVSRDPVSGGLAGVLELT